MNLYLRYVLPLLLGLLSLVLLRQLDSGRGSISDFVQYYAGTKLLLRQINPYSSEDLFAAELEIEPDLDEVVRVWVPPTSFTLVLPFTILSYEGARLAWGAVALLVVVFAAGFLIKENAGFGSIRKRILLYLLIVSFRPIYSVLFWGQISWVLLLGLTLYLTALRKRRWNWSCSFAGGLGLALVCIKPHLVHLVLLFVVLEAGRSGRGKTLLGLLCGTLGLALVPVILHGQVFYDYLASFEAPPFYWQTPTLGSFLQGALPEAPRAIRFLPMLVGAVAFLALYFRFRAADLNKPAYLYALIPWSLATSPYGWLYDQLLMLPTVIWVGYKLLQRHGSVRNIGFGALLAFNFVLMSTPGSLGQQSSVWYPIIIGAFSLFIVSSSLKESSARNEANRS